MKRERLAIVACVVAMFAATLVPAPAAADTASGPTIVYSETYWRYIALFPGGAASNACELAVALSGTTGVCTADFAPVWFYPDGTTGERRWVVDSSSPIGWSVEPDPCAAPLQALPAETWWPLYIAYYDFAVMGLTATRPEGVTDQQGWCLIGIYGF